MAYENRAFTLEGEADAPEKCALPVSEPILQSDLPESKLLEESILVDHTNPNTQTAEVLVGELPVQSVNVQAAPVDAVQTEVHLQPVQTEVLVQAVPQEAVLQEAVPPKVQKETTITSKSNQTKRQGTLGRETTRETPVTATTKDDAEPRGLLSFLAHLDRRRRWLLLCLALTDLFIYMNISTLPTLFPEEVSFVLTSIFITHIWL